LFESFLSSANMYHKIMRKFIAQRHIEYSLLSVWRHLVTNHVMFTQ